MKSGTQFNNRLHERRIRRFSTEWKEKKVREIVEGRSSPSEICKAYELSRTSIYKWLDLYSGKQKPERTIVESKSDTTKILALQKRIAELERALGQKQILLEFKDKMIELAEDTYKVDIKKKFGTKP
jgi:transposase-like protein